LRAKTDAHPDAIFEGRWTVSLICQGIGENRPGGIGDADPDRSAVAVLPSARRIGIRWSATFIEET
jgi:hypothetical protein